jgi:hypothetical protein
VIEAYKRKDAEKRIPVLRLEIDYELASLHDAMVASDAEAVGAIKERLEKYRQEMVLLEG